MLLLDGPRKLSIARPMTSVDRLSLCQLPLSTVERHCDSVVIGYVHAVNMTTTAKIFFLSQIPV